MSNLIHYGYDNLNSHNIKYIYQIFMNDYFTYTQLLGLRDFNLTPFRQIRLQHFQSVKKMLDLIDIAKRTMPQIPPQSLIVDRTDPQWDDKMPFPTINHERYFWSGLCFSGLLFFYSYNYNTFTHNIRYRTFRSLFPFVIASFFSILYTQYRQSILRINLFDQYCYLRSRELVDQNKYLLDHEDIKKLVYWRQDLTETMKKVYRQGHDHKQSDFKDSELLLQDFINRYVDPNAASPMKHMMLDPHFKYDI